MLDFTVSFWPLVILSLVNFILSWLWYSPALLGKPWMKALGIGEKREMTDAEKRAMPFLFASGIVSSVLTVYGMMVVINSLKVTAFWSGLLVGVVVWAGFVLTHSLNTLWEGRKPVVLAINNGLFLLTYALYGGLLAVFK